MFVYLQVRHPGTLFLRSLYHHLSENIRFVWSKTSYSGDKRRCYQAGQTNERTTTTEDRATQPLGCWKAEFRNIYKPCDPLGLSKMILILAALFSQLNAFMLSSPRTKRAGPNGLRIAVTTVLRWGREGGGLFKQVCSPLQHT